MANLPNTDLVATSWLKTLPGVNPLRVASSLPGDNASWADTGFVVATSVGGSPGLHVPMQRPVVAIDCWANNPNSQKAPWGKAGHLAQLVLLGTYMTEPVDLTFSGDFEPARVFAVAPLSEPRKVPGDEAGFARYSFDLVFNWVVVR